MPYYIIYIIYIIYICHNMTGDIFWKLTGGRPQERAVFLEAIHICHNMTSGGGSRSQTGGHSTSEWSASSLLSILSLALACTHKKYENMEYKIRKNEV